MSKYQDAPSRIQRESFAYGLLLKAKYPKERTRTLADLLEIAMLNKRWEEAVSYFNWLFYAMEDAHLLPFCEGQDGLFLLPWSQAVELAQLTAEKEKADLALQIYCELATKAPSGSVAALLCLKRFLLEAILKHWADRKTPDQEADKLLTTLLSTIKPDSKDEEMAAETVYKVASQITYDRRPRLTSALLLLKQGDGIAKNLVLNWAKIGLENFGRFQEELKVTQLLEGASAGVISYLQKETATIATFDAKLRDMVKVLQPADSLYRPGYVPGRITWTFRSTRAVDILVTTAVDASLNNQHPKGALDKLGDEYFKNARDRIRQWSSSLTEKYHINLELRLVHRYDTKKILFSHSHDTI